MYAGLHVKFPLFLTAFAPNRNVLILFPKKIPSTKFRETFNHWESRYCVGTDRQTDIMERNKL